MRITRLSCCIHLPCPRCPSSRRGAGPRCTWDDGSLQDCRSVKPGGERNCGEETCRKIHSWIEPRARACERAYTWLPLRIESNVDRSKVSKVTRWIWRKGGQGESCRVVSPFPLRAPRFLRVTLSRRGARASHEREARPCRRVEK